MKKILFIVSEDWYFVSHRLHLAIAAIENDYEVALLCRVSRHKEFLESKGIHVFEWPLDRSSHNPLKEIVSIYYVVKTIRVFKPNLIHSVSFKPVIYSLLSRFFYRAEGLILALAGLGFVFRSKSSFAKILRLFFINILRLLFLGENLKLVIQNNDDINLLLQLKIININKIRLIRGSGVSPTNFFPKHDLHEIPLVILPARMLWNKGVEDFINVAKRFFNTKNKVRFALIGEPDFHNPESITIEQLKEWAEQGIVEWWGKQNDMCKIYHLSDIVCFPSYHEGLPKALLEAASCEIPIVAYDVPGCREVVKNNLNGFLVPFKNENTLYLSVLKLLENPKLRIEMGKKGREIVVKNFTEVRISSETLKVWSEFLS